MTLESISTSLNYLSDTVEHSLYRNGKVLIRRDIDGNDVEFRGVLITPRTVEFQNARIPSESGQMALKTNGFELLDCPFSTKIDFLDNIQVLKNYYPICADIVKEATNASSVIAFDHNVRNSPSGESAKKRIRDGQIVQQPIQNVHGDYTLCSAPQRLRDFTKPLGKNDTLRYILNEGETVLSKEIVESALDKENNGRFAIINVWRNISTSPLEKDPIGLCDGQSVLPEDLVVHEIHYTDRVGENYFAKYSKHHKWYYYPQMRRDEALLIKQWDSAGEFAKSDGHERDGSNGNPDCTFSFHTAFEDPTTAIDAPERQSIEVRCIVLF